MKKGNASLCRLTYDSFLLLKNLPFNLDGVSQT